MAPVQEPGEAEATYSPAGGRKCFECQVIGLPRPSIRWYKDGLNITQNKRYKVAYTGDGVVLLTLDKVTHLDEGKFSCVAENSEGMAETSAVLFVKGKVSTADNDITSVHTMTSFRRVESPEPDMTSQSRRRPLVVKTTEENDNAKEISNKEIKPDSESIDGKIKIENKDETEVGLAEDDANLETYDEELIKIAKFSESRRRLTTDSGITSRGSSFSSESDVNITENEIREIREYLHGKADAIYQPYDQHKVKKIPTSEEKTQTMKGNKTKTEQILPLSKRQPTYSLQSTEQLKWEKVNDVDASVLAGMYLFDTGNGEIVMKSRHGLPELEILVRKEADMDDLLIENAFLTKRSILNVKNDETGCTHDTQIIEFQNKKENDQVTELMDAENKNSETLNLDRKADDEKLKYMDKSKEQGSTGRKVNQQYADKAAGDELTNVQNEAGDQQSANYPKENEAEKKLDIKDYAEHEINSSLCLDEFKNGGSEEDISSTKDITVALKEVDSDLNVEMLKYDISKIISKNAQDTVNNDEPNLQKTKDDKEIMVASVSVPSGNNVDQPFTDKAGDDEMMNVLDDADNVLSAKYPKDNEEGNKSVIEGFAQYEMNVCLDELKYGGLKENESSTKDKTVAVQEVESSLNVDLRTDDNSKVISSTEPDAVNNDKSNSYIAKDKEIIIARSNHCDFDAEMNNFDLKTAANDDIVDGAKINNQYETDLERCEYSQKSRTDDSYEKRAQNVNHNSQNQLENEKDKAHVESPVDFETEVCKQSEETLYTNDTYSFSSEGMNGYEFVLHDIEEFTDSGNLEESKLKIDDQCQQVNSDTHENESGTKLQSARIDTIETSAEKHLNTAHDDTDLAVQNLSLNDHKTKKPTDTNEDFGLLSSSEMSATDNDSQLSLQKCSYDKKPETIVQNDAGLQESGSNITTPLKSSENDMPVNLEEADENVANRVSPVTKYVENDDVFPDCVVNDEVSFGDSRQYIEIEQLHTVSKDDNLANERKIGTVEAPEFLFFSENMSVEDKEGNVEILASASEHIDPGMTFSGSNIHDGLVSLEDTYAEIPNIVNVMDFFKDQQVRIKQASRSDELENATKIVRPLKDTNYDGTNCSTISSYSEEGLVRATCETSSSMTCIKTLTELQSHEQTEKEISVLQEVPEDENRHETVPQYDEYQSKEKQREVIGHDKTNMVTNLGEVDVDESANTKNNDVGREPIIQVEALCDGHLEVQEGSCLVLDWEISGITHTLLKVYKDGIELSPTKDTTVKISENKIWLENLSSSRQDEGIYFIKADTSDVELGHIAVRVVSSAAGTIAKEETTEVPAFTLEPQVTMVEGQRLSIKCSVSGFPAPGVTWYRHGEPLDHVALCSVYSKDGYHYLAIDDPSLLDCGEIVCHVENDVGFIHKVLALKTQENETSDDVRPTDADIEADIKAPVLELQISEILTVNLRRCKTTSTYTDRLNFTTLDMNEGMEILACNFPGQKMLARNMPKKDKVCFVPENILEFLDDDVGSVGHQKQQIATTDADNNLDIDNTGESERTS
ncbi:titin homolog [Mya arenaria]|uniref:titin homolog n=1 Tax=Mya arenaria TaxID=6604 RepID=UPI0022E09F73|nr:titin homolog [Mya arenaria]